MSATSVTFDVFRGTAGQIAPDQVTRELKQNEVYIEVTHSGICGTDMNFLHSGKVLGHEGVGIVRQLGPGVTSAKVGDRVGFGYTRKVCGHCAFCLAGWDQYCENVNDYALGDADQGTLSSGAIWDADCVRRIPDALDSADAAPLLCAGGTVWTILTEYGVRPNDRVGVLGIGGLGHLAIKFAAALGYHVVVLSSSESKRQEAMEFGAKEYYVLKSGERPEGFQSLNHLLACSSGSGMDYTFLVSLMRNMGTIYPITASQDKIPVRLLDMTRRGIRMQGSLVASRRSLDGILEFAAAHQITPTLQKFPFTAEGIENAVAVLKSGKMRYRGVVARE